MTKKSFLFITSLSLLILILFPLLSATTVSGENYSVGSAVSSSQGGNIAGDNYTSRTYLIANTGGSANNSLYYGVIGLFGKFKNPPPIPLTLSITFPKNGTYLDKKSIPLNYSSTGAD